MLCVLFLFPFFVRIFLFFSNHKRTFYPNTNLTCWTSNVVRRNSPVISVRWKPYRRLCHPSFLPCWPETIILTTQTNLASIPKLLNFCYYCGLFFVGLRRTLHSHLEWVFFVFLLRSRSVEHEKANGTSKSTNQSTTVTELQASAVNRNGGFDLKVRSISEFPSGA